ncbi:MAG: histidine phosphatase family protein [Actinomycetota bacterium]
MAQRGEIVLVRHGETEWSRAGKHTGRTDIPLTSGGRDQARQLGGALRNRRFALVLTSPLRRASETCRLAGLGDAAEECSDLREWDYGDYEGRTTADIRTEVDGWTIWTHEVPGGETAAKIARRADRVVDLVRTVDGDVALFGHGHILRVLAARWCGLDAVCGRFLALDTGTLSILGYERESPVIRLWNRIRE